MSIITDPDALVPYNHVAITPGTKTIGLTLSGVLSTDGVGLQCLYSFLKEEWKDNVELIKYPFPMLAITEEKFELINGWDFLNQDTKNLIRTGGWALKDTGGVTQEEYAGIISLGTLGGTDQVYYQQVTAGPAVNIVLPGAVNQAVKTYGDGSHGSYDYRSYFKIFCREYQKSYASSQLSDIGVSTMTYQVYRFPVTNASDAKITHTDPTVSGTGVYTGMSIEWFAAPQTRSIGGNNRDFHVIIDGNSGTAEQIYEFVQWSLRSYDDIDDGAGEKIGKVTNDLVRFVGDTLYTRFDSTGGVYIDNFQTIDRNRLYFMDDLGVERFYPYVAILTLQFGDNLVADTTAIYRVFFTNDDAGDNAGYDYGTADAISVNNSVGATMSGTVGGSTSVQLAYDYDGNDQRGLASKGIDAPITVVALGLATAQYVKATGNIAKSTANVVSLVAPLERNYVNP
jgi:hypothetical protein